MMTSAPESAMKSPAAVIQWAYLQVEVAASDFQCACERALLAAKKRATGAGAHQLKSPNRRIVAGTMSTRTKVASIATAIAIPRPIAFTTTTVARVKAAKTATMIAAALVISPPVLSSPSATEWGLSAVRRYSS